MQKTEDLEVSELPEELRSCVTDIFIDCDGHESEMRWIPRFEACRALSVAAASATQSGTIGDWFSPRELQAGWIPGTDYETIDMGGYWVDMYLCSAANATKSSRGTICGEDGAPGSYVSQRGVAPMVYQDIAHFRKFLAARFEGGSFAGSGAEIDWSGKGGLITDAHWFELWIWTRINRWALHGNTNGYRDKKNIPSWHKDREETGLPDGSLPEHYGVSVTGGGPRSWDVPVSDFCGNRWEFTEGLRLINGSIYTSGKSIRPWSNPEDGYDHPAFKNTGLRLTNVESGGSIASYRTEEDLKLHGIPGSSCRAGEGGFDGGDIWLWNHDEVIAVRGGGCGDGSQCPGALGLYDGPSAYYWSLAARAVLVP